MEKIFENGKHLILSDDPQKTIELVNYYLLHEKERDTIAEQGQKYVLENHTYTHRIKKMMGDIYGN